MDPVALDALRIVLDPVGQAGIAVALMLVMFGVALGLSVKDFLYIKRQPVGYLGGVVTQIVGLPLATYLLVHLIAPPPSIALGMFVVACCPGGAVSNLFTYLARGAVAYSVALTATSSVLAALITPVSILFWSNAYEPTAQLLQSVEVNSLAFLLQTTLLLAVPLVLGMIVAVRAPDVAERIRRRTAQVGSLVLLGVVIYGSYYFFPVLSAALPLLLAIAAVHNGVAFLLGIVVAYLLRADRPTRRALTIEVGIQNSGLAIVILLAQLEGLGGAAAIAAVWGVWHILAGGLIVSVLRLVDKRRATGQE